MPPLEQIEEVFHQALNLPAGEDRMAWLAERCSGDTDLHREVASLLMNYSLAKTAKPNPIPGGVS